jgi:hypothetical protein
VKTNKADSKRKAGDAVAEATREAETTREKKKPKKSGKTGR